MKFSFYALALILWFVASQDILRALEDDEAIDIAAGEAKQRYFALTQYRIV